MTGTLPAYIDIDDVRQVKAMARLEAEAAGIDVEAMARLAARRYIAAERAHHRRFAPASKLRGASGEGTRSDDLRWLEEARKVVGISPPRALSPGRSRKFVRDQAILALTIAGFSQRTIAGMFGLPHSRVAAILDRMRAIVA